MLTQKLKNEVLIQYNNRCGCCLASSCSLEIHHIVPKNAGGLDKKSNLILLCHSCHSQLTGVQRAVFRG